MTPESSPTIAFRNVRAVDPSRELDEVVDVVIEGGIITRAGKGAVTDEMQNSESMRVIDCSDKWLVPAFVDLHAHFREPGQEYKEDIESGLGAAAAGGFAHVCAMPNTKPVNDRRSITEAMVQRGREVGGPKLHPIGAITMGQLGKELTEMADLKEAGAVAVSDDGHCVMSSAVMRRALEYARTFDMPVIQHCEDHDLTEGALMHEGAISARRGLRGWPRVAEDIIVARDLLLTEVTGGRYHVAHISSHRAVQLVREAKERGLAVTAEVTPHHLMLTDEAVLGYDTACKVNPPLREQIDVDAVRAGLADGTIDAIATDHAPHSSLEKDCEFAEASHGMIGLELVVPLLLSLVQKNVLSLARVVDALTKSPSRIVSLEAPSIVIGRRADLCLIDPKRPFTVERSQIRSKSLNTPFKGQTFVGRVEQTLAGGNLVFQAPPPDASGDRSTGDR